MSFHHVVLVSFPDVPVRALGLKALKELIFFSVPHLGRVTDLSVLAPDLILEFTLWDLDSECTGVPNYWYRVVVVVVNMERIHSRRCDIDSECT